ncbi:sigma-54 interaction domain-containing protein [Aliidiomarina sp. Khilg15.8]
MQQRPRLFLHIEDEAVIQQLLEHSALKQYQVTISQPGSGCMQQLEQATPQVAVVEITPAVSAELTSEAKLSKLAAYDFILLSGGQPDPVIDALITRGAGFHYRTPYNLSHLGSTLYELSQLHQAHRAGRRKAVCSELEQFGLLLGSSAPMRELYQMLRKVAATEAHVFVSGESGAGKELVAHTLHAASERADKPFIALNCGALSPELVDSELFGHVKGAFTGAQRDHKGVFEQANGGTIFLDEITEMPLEHQVKLLRVLENGEYRPVGSSQTLQSNVRVVAATNRQPEEAVAQGRFREDLYFRLAQFPLQVPPLRERGEDIVGLARHFLAHRNAQEGLAKRMHADTIAHLRAHRWPGNVRELKHAVERAFILANQELKPEHFKLQAGTAKKMVKLPAGMALKDLEQAVIENTLHDQQGNKTASAAQLGISIKTLYNKLDKYQGS